MSLLAAAHRRNAGGGGGGAPSYGAIIGNQTTTSYLSSMNVTLSAGASIGQRVVLRINMASPGSQIISSITDTAGNTYTKHIGVTSTYAYSRGEVWSAPVTSALSGGNTVTVNFSSTRDVYAKTIICTLNDTSGTVVTGDQNSDVSPGTTENNSISTGAAAVCLSMSDIATTTTYTTATNYTDEIGNVQFGGYTFRAQYRVVAAATTTDSGGVWGASARWLNTQVAFL